MEVQGGGALEPGVDRPVDLAHGVDLLARLAAAANLREAAVRDLVRALADVNRAGVVEPLEGLPIDIWLAITHGMTAAERSMLLDTGDVLASMPALDRWWGEGLVSWSVVRDTVCRVRSLGRDGRAEVDARLASSRELLADLDPDQISWAVADAVESVRGARAKERAESRDADEAFLSFQTDLWGGSRVFGQLDAVSTAVITTALDEMTAVRDQAGRGPQRDAEQTFGVSVARDINASSSPLGRRARRRSRAKDRAASLLDLCRRGQTGDAAGATTGGGPRRPLVVVHVPLDRITETAAGLLEVAVPGALPRLSAALVENLLADADVRAVLFDGARPLHVTSRLRATAMHPDTRLAVQARDLGARDPGGRAPVPLSHVHHLEPGVHDPDRLMTVSPRGHLRVIHRYGWTARLDPVSGAATWTRPRHTHRGQGRTIRTRPWGTRLNLGGHVPVGPPERRRRPR